MFVAPLLALVLIWAIAVPLFGINPRVFPSVAAVTGWTTLLAWHWFGQGKPMRLTPLLRFFRR